MEFSRENILKDYSNNEFELRNFIDEDEIEYKKKEYFDRLISNNYHISFNFLRNEKIQNILNLVKNKEDEEKVLYKLLLHDFYYYFLSNNLAKSLNFQKDLFVIDNFDNNVKYLNLIIDIRNDIINSSKEYLDRTIQRNSDITWIICRISLKLIYFKI